MAEFIHTDRSQDTVFDVDAERLGSVYAEAALDAAGGDGEQESLVRELESLVEDLLDRDPRLEQLFGSALISEDDKSAMLDRLFAGRASNVTLNTLKVMARHNRLALIRDVARVARQLWMKRSGRVPVSLESANPLDPALEQEILAAFGKALGKDPVVTSRVNPELIAGFVLRVGDRVYDASVRTRLEHMRQGMVHRAVDAIQRTPQRFFSEAEA
jgi:F-type H+-transporting ATPase subunit delta